MPDYACNCGSKNKWLKSLPLWAVNFHKVGSAQSPSSNLETKVIPMSEKVVGVPLKDYLILPNKNSPAWILYLQTGEKEEQPLRIQLADLKKTICR